MLERRYFQISDSRNATIWTTCLISPATTASFLISRSSGGTFYILSHIYSKSRDLKNFRRMYSTSTQSYLVIRLYFYRVTNRQLLRKWNTEEKSGVYSSLGSIWIEF
jgi:hypothetical protein